MPVTHSRCSSRLFSPVKIERLMPHLLYSWRAIDGEREWLFFSGRRPDFLKSPDEYRSSSHAAFTVWSSRTCQFFSPVWLEADVALSLRTGQSARSHVFANSRREPRRYEDMKCESLVTFNLQKSCTKAANSQVDWYLETCSSSVRIQVIKEMCWKYVQLAKHASTIAFLSMYSCLHVFL